MGFYILHSLYITGQGYKANKKEQILAGNEKLVFGLKCSIFTKSCTKFEVDFLPVTKDQTGYKRDNYAF